jgi:hypothetical protein
MGIYAVTNDAYCELAGFGCDILFLFISLCFPPSIGNNHQPPFRYRTRYLSSVGHPQHHGKQLIQNLDRDSAALIQSENLK